MFYTDPKRIVFRGQPADLVLIRNNGCAWGRLTPVGATESLDVTLFDANGDQVDVYDMDDDEALALLEESSSKHPDRCSPSVIHEL